MIVNNFDTSKFLIHELESDTIFELTKEVSNIKSNWNNYNEHNVTLAGNIKREYTLPHGIADSFIKRDVSKLLYQYDDETGYLTESNKNSLVKVRERELEFSDIWVNFQKKYEFNPVHNHTGVVSFVIWHSIPYDMEEELIHSPGYDRRNKKEIITNGNCSGQFAFVYADTINGLKVTTLPVDKSWNNKICIFPSSLMHAVYPFYSSDDYRITLSGNLVWKN